MRSACLRYKYLGAVSGQQHGSKWIVLGLQPLMIGLVDSCTEVEKLEKCWEDESKERNGKCIHTVPTMIHSYCEPCENRIESYRGESIPSPRAGAKVNRTIRQKRERHTLLPYCKRMILT
jgi:hypothetical protein